jgi:hypothetical protein
MRSFIFLVSFTALISAPLVHAQITNTGSNAVITTGSSPADASTAGSNKAPAIDDNQVWVNIAVLRNGAGGGIFHFYGSVARPTFNGMVRTLVPGGYLQLNNTSWFNADGTFSHASDERARNGDSFGNTDVSYFRADLITQIIILDRDFVKLHFGNDKNEPLEK